MSEGGKKKGNSSSNNNNNNKQGRRKSPAKGDLQQQLKGMFPKMSDGEVEKTLRACNNDEEQLRKWIETQFDDKEQWSEVGAKRKPSKPSRQPDRRSQPRAGGTGPSAKTPRKPRDSNARGGGGEEKGPRPGQATFAIPKSRHLSIIGPQGTTVQGLQAELRVKITIPDRNKPTSCVVVAGEASAVEATRLRLQELTGFPLPGGEVGAVTLVIPKRLHPMLIGKQGAGLGAIETDAGCAVNFPPRESSSSDVVVEGTRECVDKAVNRLLEQCANDNVSVEVIGGQFRTGAQQPALFVGNLNFKNTKQDLVRLVEGMPGVVAVHLLRHSDSLRSKGSGVVVFESSDAATRAAQQLQNTELDGRTLTMRAGFVSKHGAGVDAEVAHNDPPPQGHELHQPHQSQPDHHEHHHHHHHQFHQAHEQQREQHQHQHQHQHQYQHQHQQHQAHHALPMHHGGIPNGMAPLPNVNQIAPDDQQAHTYADDMIQKLKDSPSSFNLDNALRQLSLARANNVQQIIRVKLQAQLAEQQGKCEDLNQRCLLSRHRADELSREVAHKKDVHQDLTTKLHQLQQSLEAAESELLQLENEHHHAQQVVESEAQHQRMELEASGALGGALAKAEESAMHITNAWQAWLAKLNKSSFDQWTFADMDTLLHCLDLDAKPFHDNGIEPALLACIDDQVLRDIQVGDRPLVFGERRFLLITVRGILNQNRPPLGPHAASVSVRDVVCYLTQWGLNLPPQKPDHMMFWTTQQVAGHFRALGQEEAARGCERGLVRGVVLLTMYRSNCFDLELPTLGDTLNMWKEVETLQNTALGRSAVVPEWASKRNQVLSWSVEDVAKFFESRELGDIADVCRREKMSGFVLLAVERADLDKVHFARPGDRIRLTQTCKQLSTGQ